MRLIVFALLILARYNPEKHTRKGKKCTKLSHLDFSIWRYLLSHRDDDARSYQSCDTPLWA